MKVALLTLFPEMFRAISDFGVSGRAVKQGHLSLGFFNPRSYADDKHQTVDARPYSGGPGMVMMFEPLLLALQAAKQWVGEDSRVVYLSPQGKVFRQSMARGLSVDGKNLVLLAGRYEGIDERFIELFVDDEWSVGDYVLSGGELAAMVVLDSVVRLLPEVLGNEASAGKDSFGEDGLLDYPHYTKPEEVCGKRVPEVLLSGHHERIRLWRLKQSLGRTFQRRPELLEGLVLNEEQKGLLEEYRAEHVGKEVD